MQSGQHIGRMRTTRYRCAGLDELGCGAPALYRDRAGRMKGNKDHRLCGACWARARALGRRAARQASIPILKGQAS